MNRILITGGVGYLGGRLAQFLRSHPDGPTLRLMTRRTREHLPVWTKEFDVVSGDVMDRDTLARAVEGVSTVIHLAAPNEIESARDPEHAIAVAGIGTYRLLTECRKAGVGQFIYFSTIHVYGGNLQGTITEATVPRPVHPYGISRRLAEDLVLAESKENGMATLVFRLANGYGAPADPAVNRWTLVFNDLCRQAVRDHHLVLQSSGRQRRDFISLYNAARAVGHMLALPRECWGDGLYNLGGSRCLSIVEVAERVAETYRRFRERTIEIKLGADIGATIQRDFTYSTEKLQATGFEIVDNMEEEILCTFQLCELERTELAKIP